MSRSHPQLEDGEQLRSLYDEHSTLEIAQRLGVGKTTVTTWMARHGIVARDLSEARKRYLASAADRSHGRNRQMVTAGVANVRGVHHTETQSLKRGMHTGD